MHQQHAPDAFVLVFDGIEHARAARDHARIDAHEGDRTDERIVHDLEGETGERRLVVWRALYLLVGVRHFAHQRRNIQRRRKIIDDCVQQRLHAFVLEGRAAHHRNEFEAGRALADAALEVVNARHLAIEIGYEKRFVLFHSHLDQVGMKFPGFLKKADRNVYFVEFRAKLFVVPDKRPHRHEIDDTAEVRLGADRPSDDQGPGAQTVDHHLHAARKVGAHAVHLVDEADARNLVLVGLAPNGFRLRLHARHRVEHGDGTVEHAHGTFHLDGEVHMARRVDDVDAMFTPITRCGGRGDGNAAFLLLLHEVHGRSAVVHFADFMAFARIIENTLGRRRLAGIDMRGNADVAVFIERRRTGHHKILNTRYQR